MELCDCWLYSFGLITLLILYCVPGVRKPVSFKKFKMLKRRAALMVLQRIL